jgi:hypothetical protein
MITVIDYCLNVILHTYLCAICIELQIKLDFYYMYIYIYIHIYIYIYLDMYVCTYIFIKLIYVLIKEIHLEESQVLQKISECSVSNKDNDDRLTNVLNKKIDYIEDVMKISDSELETKLIDSLNESERSDLNEILKLRVDNSEKLIPEIIKEDFIKEKIRKIKSNVLSEKKHGVLSLKKVRYIYKYIYI